MQIWANYNQKYQDINIHKHSRLLLLGSSGQALAICCWISLPPLFFVRSKNFEFIQTTNDKWKYKLQQLFEKLSLSLDTGLESFSPLVNGPVNDGQFEISPDIKKSLLQFSQVVCCALHAPAWCGCCYGNRAVGTQPISSFSNAINPQLNVDAFCKKNHS